MVRPGLQAQANPPTATPGPGPRYALIDLKGFYPSRLNNQMQIVGDAGIWQDGQVFTLRGGGTPADINDHGDDRRLGVSRRPLGELEC